jgi:hypothetical protein
MSQVPSAQASVAPHAVQLTSQQTSCASATVRPSVNTCAASRRVAVPGLHCDWRKWSTQVDGVGSLKTAFFMKHELPCALF